MDYDMTVAAYEKAGLIKKWQENPESYRHAKEKTWFSKVRSKRNDEFWQADEDLIKRELVLSRLATSNHWARQWQGSHISSETCNRYREKTDSRWY